MKKIKFENKNLLDFNFRLQFELRDLKTGQMMNNKDQAPKNTYTIDVSKTS